MTQSVSYRSALAAYAVGRPISYLLTVTLTIYGVARLLDDLTGGAPLVTPRWIAIRIIVALVVAALITVFVRRRARRPDTPA
jgi:predicted Co/Zn/Cd cation transporter (cation efflux family)